MLASVFHQLRRDVGAVQHTADGVMALSAEHGITESLAFVTILRGSAMAAQGRCEEGIALIQQGSAMFRAAGVEGVQSQNLCWLAEACMEAGRFDDGLSALTEALAAADEYENRFYEAETHRLKGELLLMRHGDGRGADTAEARSCFERAIEVARKQSARSLELRTTIGLARLLASQGRRDEARARLADIYGWFTEGFDTADLKDAKALLDQLGI